MNPKPNIILINCDDNTPNLDRLAAEGVRFTDYHVMSPVCSAVLKQQGYRTKIVGKWHLGDQPGFLPTKHGFDEHYGLPDRYDMGIQEPPEKRLGRAKTSTTLSPAGRVENPKPLATYNELHPHIVATYDTPDTGVMGG